MYKYINIHTCAHTHIYKSILPEQTSFLTKLETYVDKLVSKVCNINWKWSVKGHWKATKILLKENFSLNAAKPCRLTERKIQLY